MRNVTPAAILIAFTFWGCVEHKPVKQPVMATSLVAYEDPDGYAVLSQLLEKKGEGWRNTVIRISALTTQENSDSNTSFEKCIKVPDEFAEAANSFREISKNSYVLQDRFDSDAHFQIVDRPGSGQSSENRPKAKKSIEQMISGGTYFVSPVGFDSNKTHAIVRINYICGGTCGGGEYHLLVRSDDVWNEVKPKSFCFWQY